MSRTEESFDPPLLQTEIATHICALVEAHLVPPVVLFEGPLYSGRTTTALELARLIHCERARERGCRCAQCLRIRALRHPSLALVGTRYCTEEIVIALRALTARREWALYSYLQRATERLLRHCDPHVLDVRALPHSKTIEETARVVVEKLSQLKATHRTGGDSFKDTAATFIEKVHALESLLPSHTTVAHIRKLIRWMHIGESENFRAHKVVVCENVDNYSPTVHNLLLKTLEEPLPGVTVVLIARHRSSLPLTIRSRAAHYFFSTPSAEAERAALRALGADSTVSTFESYFRLARDDEAVSEEIARLILKSVESAQGGIQLSAEIEKKCATLKAPTIERILLKVTRSLFARWHTAQSPLATQRTEEIYSFLNVQYRNARTLNINFSHQIVTIIATLRSVYGFVS